MELPGTNYGRGVESLTKLDTQGPLKVAEARQGARAAATRLATTTSKVTTEIYQNDALTQVAAATPVYQEAMQKQIVATKSFDKDNKGVWTQQGKVFKEYVKNAKGSVDSKLTNPLARKLFEQKSLELNASLHPAYTGAVDKMQTEYAVGAFNKELDTFLNGRQFDLANDAINRAMYGNVISPPQRTQYNKAVDYGRYNYSFEQDVEKLTVRGQWKGHDIVAFREKVKNDARLIDSDKAKVIGTLESNMINNMVDQFHMTLAPVQADGGKVAAFMEGDKLLKDFQQIPAKELGGDENWRHKTYEALRQAQLHYKTDLKKNKGSYDFLIGARNRINGDEYYDQDIGGLYHVMLGRNVNKKGEREHDGTGYSDQDVMANKDNTLLGFATAYTTEQGRIPADLENMVSAAIEGGAKNPEFAQNGMKFLGALLEQSPEALRWQSESYHLNDIASLIDFYGNSEEGHALAQTTWQQYKKIENDPVLFKSRQELKDTVQSAKYFNEEFADSLSSFFGKDKGILWLDKDVSLRTTVTADAKTLYGKYMTITGDQEKSLSMATRALRFTYDTTEMDADGVMRLAKYPVEKFVKSKILDSAEVKEAVRWQVKTELNLGGQRIDNYTMEPVAKFSTEKPQYLIKSMNENGLMSVLVYTPELEKTPQYKRKTFDVMETQRLQDELGASKIAGAQNKLAQQKEHDKFRSVYEKDTGMEYKNDGRDFQRGYLRLLMKTKETKNGLFGLSSVEGDEEYATWQLVNSKLNAPDKTTMQSLKAGVQDDALFNALSGDE